MAFSPCTCGSWRSVRGATAFGSGNEGIHYEKPNRGRHGNGICQRNWAHKEAGIPIPIPIPSRSSSSSPGLEG